MGHYQTAPCVDLRPMAIHVLLDFIRWQDSSWVPARHARPQLPCPSLPLGLFLDEAV